MTIVAHADRTPRRGAGAESIGPRQAQRVLILEDHGLLAMLTAEVLGGMGHRVCASAATPSAAAATLHLPDLMIVDVHLQDGSGSAAVRKIIALNGFVPHVFITGQGAQPGAPWPVGTGLRKPFGIMELGQAIQHVLHAVPPGTAVGAMAEVGIDGPGR
jgi:CheY-like chemotaxis protein